MIALDFYGVVATLQSDDDFGPHPVAYDGIGPHAVLCGIDSDPVELVGGQLASVEEESHLLRRQARPSLKEVRQEHLRRIETEFESRLLEPLAVLLPADRQALLLRIVSPGAPAGIAFRVLWVKAPRWLYTPCYLTLGWAPVRYLPDFLHTGGAAVVTLPTVAAFTAHYIAISLAVY
ncbi:hypothetical protein ACFYU4_12295 [Streptomyces tendae]|uniref:hypothetical protein n=1 Tax=Streptomyces tendae TaxID=1932 RepID=UPI0036CCD5F3